jgi:hypothetical protein
MQEKSEHSQQPVAASSSRTKVWPPVQQNIVLEGNRSVCIYARMYVLHNR